MPRTNFAMSSSGIVVPAPAITAPSRKHIQLDLIWFELSRDATLVSLRWGENGEDMFPKTKSGLAACNLIGVEDKKGPEGTALYLHIEGNVTVRGTIFYTLH